MVSFENSQSSGKHMVCDIKDIENMDLLHDLEGIQYLLDSICTKFDFQVLQKISHQFEPEGITILYLLSESHISIHTFPEKKILCIRYLYLSSLRR